MYFTRDYTFHTYEYCRQRATSNYGICVKGETNFYRILTEINEVEFPRILKLKCVLFKCKWFHPVVSRGVRFNKFGVVDVNGGRRYNKFEPFILASQANQVSFLPYPRMRESRINWLAVTKLHLEDESSVEKNHHCKKNIYMKSGNPNTKLMTSFSLIRIIMSTKILPTMPQTKLLKMSLMKMMMILVMARMSMYPIDVFVFNKIDFQT
ncbi:uncharacterized protein LOC125589904 [Brassica napus]|uniref:uncharacterized protein LOC125589904 n=1 Tax=Brassica napus TaxID=3708 RepID=UPI00207A45CD|nr:uncharacterized protein LOC125589904 [Brassica napus]